MNKKEKWQDIYTKDDLIKLQSIEKNLLKDFISICEKLNIEYFIYGGTLLGQVKYGGMIPWDDDIDVALTRDNYNRFLNEAPKILPDSLVLQTPYNEKKSPFSYTKLRKKNTLFIEKYNHKLKIDKGVYIDIYPVDNIPDDDILRKKQWNKSQFFCKLYYLRQCIHADLKEDNLNKFFKHFFVYNILRILPQSFYVKLIDKEMTKYNKCVTKRKSCLFSPNYDNIYVNLYPLVKKKFDDIEVMMPNCYDDHLRKRYGNDYMEFYPENKRIGHVPYKYSFNLKEGDDNEYK